MNLATSYIYQFDIDFQYTFGVIPILFFIAVKNLSKINRRHITIICVAAACFSCVLFMSKQYNKIHAYNFIYTQLTYDFIETDEILSQIPADASVSAAQFIAPHLIKNEKLYMTELFREDFFDYDTEYIITDLRGVDLEEYKKVLEELKDNGYRKIESGIFIEVFKKIEEQD